MKKMKTIYLSKGGIIVDTTAGAIQLGSPPETIKDSLAMNRAVPEIYIAPKSLFSNKKMLSLMDIEFPCNYNFFIMKKKTTIVCTEKQKKIIYSILEESIIGPEQINIDLEYYDGRNNPALPDMKKEMMYFRTNEENNETFKIENIVDFRTFNSINTVTINGVDIKLNNDDSTIEIIDQNQKVSLPWDINYQESDIGNRIYSDIFIPPSFGITTLGSSHGFDPKGKTSGFIFWINGVGVMVDPPVDSALWLMEQNVTPKMVNSVILTHCHSDHDSGVMQKILQEGRITLYTTPTIFSSFIKKISLLAELSVIDIIELIDFIPIMIAKPININGAMVTFSYRLHSIPTIGFEISFKNRTVVYTSDHLNDIDFFNKLLKKGILSQGRYDELAGFDWNKNIIIHEAGVPPLHTPMETLLKLPYENKRNIYLVHTDKSKIPDDSGLKISPTGLANTMIIDSTPTIHGESIEILNLITHIDIFEDTPLKKGGEILSVIKYVKFKSGDCLVKEGDINKRFFIIIAGKARVIENETDKAFISSGSYFGESSIIQNAPALNTIIAVTDIVSIVIDSDDFLALISNMNIYEKLQKLCHNRKIGSWETINNNKYFNELTINQKNNLEIILEEYNVEENEVIENYSNSMDYAYLWGDGIGLLTDENGNTIKEINKGNFIGNPENLISNRDHKIGIVAKTNSKLFRIPWQSMIKFFQQNPKLLLEMRNNGDY
ncbi:MAG: hypothetical protein A2015_01655 [Spirochaetes bacterium GWF1_31_7]|nr:MAG: hypothetical protein A2Y30_03020 [Spirochaetes bacterium GWE1_32_154]OHD48305.1 MAG: hypothetical protein A2Y29_05535 [Spirochaetes bacterium GWE2_31_10]OHD49293.1 MAG: hypothetical protein A2015_01655 [Spirochaetes bacterium GWF1_31_7]OHD81142.1 MAG: hypothetical protein A2355_16565 [Spirochaetes bacterium RIFOXYB1_FULL_32_8]HBD92967.1 hypothetical protein [Spirochaetia bacterium]